MVVKALVLPVVARMLHSFDAKYTDRIFCLQATDNVMIFRSPLFQLDHKYVVVTSQNLVDGGPSLRRSKQLSSVVSKSVSAGLMVKNF